MPRVGQGAEKRSRVAGVGVREEPGCEGHQDLSRVTEVSSVLIWLWLPDCVCWSELRTLPLKGYISIRCEFYDSLCRLDLRNTSLLK